MKKNLIYKQENTYSCGSMCIKSILSYYNGFVPEKIINDDIHLTKQGTNALFIVNALKKYGFNSQGYKVSSLKNLNKPFIAHFNKDNLNHFVVVYKTNKKILIMDPSIGFKKITRDEFWNNFSGVIITAEPIKKIVRYKNNNILKTIIKSELKKNKRKILITTTISFIVLLLNLLIAGYTKINSLVTQKTTIFFIFIIIILLKFILILFNSNLIIKITINFKKNLNNLLLTTIFKKNLKEFNNHTVGELINKINNFKTIEALIIDILFNGTLEIIIIIITNIIYFKINVVLFISYILYEIVICIIVIFFYKKYNYHFKTFKTNETNYLSLLTEFLNSILTIKSLDLDNTVINDLKKNYETLLSSFAFYIKKNMFFENSKKHLTELFILFENFLGIYLINNNKFSYISLISLNLIFTLTNNSFEHILNVFIEFIKARFYVNSLNDFLNQEADRKDLFICGVNNIMVKNYKYSYDYIKFVSVIDYFIISAGDKVLVTGLNGSGKSTFAKSLAGLYTDFKGNILIDGKDIRKIKNVQNFIVYTSKNDMLFNRSIMDNILIKNKEKNLEDIIKICKLENLINKKNMHLLEIVGEELKNLSDGEKAQIILARSLCLRPKVLIIDELLSNLSSELEDEILKNLFKKKDLILVYITHRKKNLPFNKKLKL